MLASAALALLLAGGAVGRWTAPRGESRIVTEERVVAASAYVSTVSIQRASESTARTRVVTRWEPSPAGPVVVQWRERIVEVKSNERREETARSSSVTAQATRSDRAMSSVVQQQPWTLGGVVGVGGNARRYLGLEASRRIIGPVYLGGAVILAEPERPRFSNAAVLIKVGVTW